MKEELISKLQPGDIILCRGNSVLSKSIQVFMRLYMKKLGYNKEFIEARLTNHTATVIDIWGSTYVVEAMGKGIEINPFSEAYGHKLDTIKVITPRKKYTAKEKKEISREATELCFNPTRYDIANFFYQIYKVVTTKKNKPGKWKGPKGETSKKRLYCSETSAYLANKIRNGVFEEFWAMNPVDVMLNNKYKELK